MIAPLIGWDLREMGVIYIGTVFGILGVVGVRKRTDLYKAGLWISLGCSLTYLALLFSSKPSAAEAVGNGEILFFGVVSCVLNGLISATLAIALLPVYEDWLGVTTDIKLLEVQMKTGILKELAEKAPGTYQHSMNVAVLAESAADAIGANALLARVGALYHDIGKIEKPTYFSENQFVEADKKKHSKLSPNMSSFVIRNHVKEGLELSKEFNLPAILKEFISQHHGTTLLTYFYDQALEGDEKDSVQEENYRYPGPRPNFKESAIVMLADSVEAASRSLPDVSDGELKQFVRKIVNDKFMDDQFDECDLTIHDLHLMAESLAKTLSSLLHRRVQYPTTEEIAEKESRRRPESAEDEPDGEDVEENATPEGVIDIRSEVDEYVPETEPLRDFVKDILEEHECSGADVSILFTNDEGIQKLNKQYRNLDEPTNVLSFLQSESSEEAPAIQLENGENLPITLGDIVISVDYARREAEENGETLEDRIRELVEHGLLHLLGLHHD